ncbi:MAG: hypothetical protein GY929_04295 [Actinomycetia bacterium]|nr:hypothetical protein [Actinomycetes bacterium]
MRTQAASRQRTQFPIHLFFLLSLAVLAGACSYSRNDPAAPSGPDQGVVPSVLGEVVEGKDPAPVVTNPEDLGKDFSLGPLPGTFFVGPAGNDSNDGLTEATAWRNLSKAFTEVDGGETVYVMNGDYVEQGSGAAHYGLSVNGQPDAWATISAYPGHRPRILATIGSGLEVINSSYVEFRGFELEGQGFGGANDYGYGFVAGNSHHIRVIDNIIHGFPVAGIGSTRSSHLYIADNTVYENAFWGPEQGSGISIWTPENLGFGDDVDGYSNYVIDNTVFGNENKVFGGQLGFPSNMTDGNGIILDEGHNTGYVGRTLIANNVVFDNGGRGIMVFRSGHADVLHNTVFHNGRTPALLGGPVELAAGQASDVTFANNVVWPFDGGKNINSEYSTNVVFSGNVHVGTSSAMSVPQGDTHIPGDPGLVNPTTSSGAADFRLAPGSAVVGSGQPAYVPFVPTDAEGLARSASSPTPGAYAAPGIDLSNPPPTTAPSDATAPTTVPADIDSPENASTPAPAAAPIASGDASPSSPAAGDAPAQTATGSIGVTEGPGDLRLGSGFDIGDEAPALLAFGPEEVGSGLSDESLRSGRPLGPEGDSSGGLFGLPLAAMLAVAAGAASAAALGVAGLRARRRRQWLEI